jgi:hypothetical protein
MAQTEDTDLSQTIEWNGVSYQFTGSPPLYLVIVTHIANARYLAQTIEQKLRSVQRDVTVALANLDGVYLFSTFDVKQLNELIVKREQTTDTITDLLWAAAESGVARRLN